MYGYVDAYSEGSVRTHTYVLVHMYVCTIHVLVLHTELMYIRTFLMLALL